MSWSHKVQWLNGFLALSIVSATFEEIFTLERGLGLEKFRLFEVE